MEENRKLIITALVVILGGNAGNLINTYSGEGSHDRFTGLNAAQLEARIHSEIEVINLRLQRHEIQLIECLKTSKKA